jgi:ABC-type branched-subunit amino acid transport system ATPase component
MTDSQLEDLAVELRNVRVDFGGVAAVADVSMEVAPYSVHALIGPNGAGKTTLLNVITRVVRESAGEVRLHGEDVRGLRPNQLARRGVSRTFQHPQLVDDATALENVMMGLYAVERTWIWQDLVSFRSGVRWEQRARARALEALSELGLAGYAGQPAYRLPYGVKKNVELARAWVSGPRLMLLDEPTAGLDETEVGELRDFLLKISSEVTILVVAHHLEFVLSISDVVTVMSSGQRVCVGPPQTVRSDPAVVAVYTGVNNDA